MYKQQTQFEVHSLTNSKDVIGANLKQAGRMTLTMPLLWVACHAKAKT